MSTDSSPQRLRARKYIGFYLVMIVVIIMFGLGVFAGMKIAMSKDHSALETTSNADKVSNLSSCGSVIDGVDFDHFWKIWDTLKSKYYKQPVSDQDLFYGAIQGLVFALNDPYSIYFTPKEAADFMQSLSGEFSGIGAEIGIKNSQLVVIAPIPGTPAEKAGLKSGDKILAIDKQTTVGMDTNTAVEKIRGVKNTTVELLIARAGWSEPRFINIIRTQINVPAIMWEEKPGSIAYIRVMQFNDDTTPLFIKTIKQIKSRGLKKIILDLRNNPGGYLESAVDMASEWVPTGIIVTEKFSDGRVNDQMSNGRASLNNVPTVVLVNNGSASASEIVAGALQDYGQAVIVGEKTFGKGSVQDYESFADGSALKLTVAAWYTPHGKNINEGGIVPDVIIEENWEKEEVGKDALLDQALELLHAK